VLSSGSVAVASTWSTGCSSHGIGKSVPRITWLAPTCATRWRSASGVNTRKSKWSWFRYSVGAFFKAMPGLQFCGDTKQAWSLRGA